MLFVCVIGFFVWYFNYKYIPCIEITPVITEWFEEYKVSSFNILIIQL